MSMTDTCPNCGFYVSLSPRERRLHEREIESLKAETKDAFMCDFQGGWNYHEHEDYSPDLAFECWEKYDSGQKMTPSQTRYRRREAIQMYRDWAWWRGLAAHNYRVLTTFPRKPRK